MATFCRLCLRTDKEFEVIDSFIRDILNVLCLKLKFDESMRHLICTTCNEKLKAALEFKSTCLATSDTIFPYINCAEELKLDLREIYMTEIENKPGMDLPDDQKICSLCLRIAQDEFIDILEEEVNAIYKFAPEMNIGIIKDPIICKLCFDFLNIHNQFLNNCLEIERRMESICNNIGTGRFDIHLLDSTIETDVKIEVKEEKSDEIFIKSESIDIKFEEEQRESLSQDLEGSQHSAKKELGQMGPENLLSQLEIYPVLLAYPSYTQMYIIQTQQHSEIQPQAPKRKNRKSRRLAKRKSEQTYKCDECPYEVRYKTHLKNHKKTHKIRLETQIHKCDKCKYQSKRSRLFRLHQLKHKEYEAAQIYKCKECEYQSSIRQDFCNHQLKHKQKRIYKCGKCKFQTAIKRNLHTHEAKHKINLVYKCDDCEYQSTVRNHFRQHKARHKEYKGAQMYKCDKCDYQSKIKQYFRKHQLCHKKPQEKRVYECGNCEYRSFLKCSLRRHEAKHNKQVRGLQVPVVGENKFPLSVETQGEQRRPNVQV